MICSQVTGGYFRKCFAVDLPGAAQPIHCPIASGCGKAVSELDLNFHCTQKNHPSPLPWFQRMRSRTRGGWELVQWMWKVLHVLLAYF